MVHSPVDGSGHRAADRARTGPAEDLEASRHPDSEGLGHNTAEVEDPSCLVVGRVRANDLDKEAAVRNSAADSGLRDIRTVRVQTGEVMSTGSGPDMAARHRIAVPADSLVDAAAVDYNRKTDRRRHSSRN